MISLKKKQTHLYALCGYTPLFSRTIPSTLFLSFPSGSLPMTTLIKVTPPKQISTPISKPPSLYHKFDLSPLYHNDPIITHPVPWTYDYIRKEQYWYSINKLEVSPQQKIHYYLPSFKDNNFLPLLHTYALLDDQLFCGFTIKPTFLDISDDFFSGCLILEPHNEVPPHSFPLFEVPLPITPDNYLVRSQYVFLNPFTNKSLYPTFICPISLWFFEYIKKLFMYEIFYQWTLKLTLSPTFYIDNGIHSEYLHLPPHSITYHTPKLNHPYILAPTILAATKPIVPHTYNFYSQESKRFLHTIIFLSWTVHCVGRPFKISIEKYFKMAETLTGTSSSYDLYGQPHPHYFFNQIYTSSYKPHGSSHHFTLNKGQWSYQSIT